MSGNRGYFQQLVVPAYIDFFVKLQDIMTYLTPNNLNELYDFVCNRIQESDLEELAVNFCRFGQIRLGKCDLYAKVCASLVEVLNPEFKTILYEKATDMFLRALYENKVFTIDEIRDKCFVDKTQYFFFAPELGVPAECEELRAFGPIYTRLGELSRDNWKKYNDLLEFGYDFGTLRFAMKYDDINLFIQLSHEPGFTFDKRLFPTPFERSHPCSMLAFAARYGALNCFNYMLEQGVRVDGEVAEHALIGGHPQILVAVDQRTSFHRPLVTAARYQHLEVAEWLMEKSDPSDISLENLVDTSCYRIILYFAQSEDTRDFISKWNPMNRAAFRGLMSLVHFFTSMGYSCAPSAKGVFTPLHAAASAGNLAVVQYLISRGAKIDKHYEDRNTALFFAARGGFLRTVSFLVSAEARINIGNEDGKTALIGAVESGSVPVLRLLCEEGADVLCSDDHGRAPLHYAVEDNRVDMAQILLRYGADPSQADEDGSDCFDLQPSRVMQRVLNGQSPSVCPMCSIA